MFYSKYIIKNNLFKLRNLKKNILKQDFDYSRNKIFTMLASTKMNLEELQHIMSDHYHISFYKDKEIFICDKLNQLKKCSKENDLLQLIDSVIEFMNDIDFDCMERINCFGSYGEEMYSSKMLEIVFNNLLESNTRDILIFQDQCKQGGVLEIAKSKIEKSFLYGIEQSNSYAERAKQKNIKVAKGNLKGSRISNNVFDLFITDCPFHVDLDFNTHMAMVCKKEKLYISSILKYINDDGILFLRMPYFRLQEDIASLLAKNFKNIQIFKTPYERDNLESLYIYILAQKKENKEIDKIEYEKLRKVMNFSNIPFYNQVEFKKYSINSRIGHVDTFKGSVLDLEELATFVQTSGCFKEFFEKQSLKKIQDNKQQPLLPFNTGQLGLVLTSGCLDGIIDEGNGKYHLVKGRVSKKTDTETSVSIDNEYEQTEIISNRVEINILLPNGDFKILT